MSRPGNGSSAAWAIGRPTRLAENQPAINIAINVGVQQLGQSEYEVSLKLEGKALPGVEALRAK